MSKKTDDMGDGFAVGKRTAEPHAQDGWIVERRRTEETGAREDDNKGFPAGGEPGRHK